MGIQRKNGKYDAWYFSNRVSFDTLDEAKAHEDEAKAAYKANGNQSTKTTEPGAAATPSQEFSGSNSPRPASNSGSSAGAAASGNQSAERFTNFNAALNVAVDQARTERQDKTLDFLGGVIPKGAAPASTFANVLSAFDSDSAPLEASLLNKSSDFVLQQEETKAKAITDIQALALEVGATGDDQAVAAILEFAKTGDIDGAIKAATGFLGATGTWSDNQKLKLESELGPDWAKTSTRAEQVQVVMPKATSKGPSGQNPSSPSADPSTGIDLLNGVNSVKDTAKELEAQVKKMMAPGIANEIITKLTSRELRLFVQDWVDEQTENRMSIDPIKYFATWFSILESTRDEGGGQSAKDDEAIANQGKRTFDGK